MKDWNSLSIDRYYEGMSNSDIAVGILDISRDIDSNFIAKRTFDMTYFYVNRMLKMKICSYVGTDSNVKKLLNAAIDKKQKYCMIVAQGCLLYRGPSLVQQSLEYTNICNFHLHSRMLDNDALINATKVFRHA